jgi:hypothetical protein
MAKTTPLQIHQRSSSTLLIMKISLLRNAKFLYE